MFYSALQSCRHYLLYMPMKYESRLKKKKTCLFMTWYTLKKCKNLKPHFSTKLVLITEVICSFELRWEKHAYWVLTISVKSLLPKSQSQNRFNTLSLYQCTTTNSNSRAKRTFKCNSFFCGFLAEIKVHAGTGETKIPQACALHSSSNETVLNWVDHRIWLKSNYPRLSKIWKPSTMRITMCHAPCHLPEISTLYSSQSPHN